jgi:hypothetical protein
MDYTALEPEDRGILEFLARVTISFIFHEFRLHYASVFSESQHLFPQIFPCERLTFSWQNFEGYFLLKGYEVRSGRYLPAFWGKVLPQSSRWNIKPKVDKSSMDTEGRAVCFRRNLHFKGPPLCFLLPLIRLVRTGLLALPVFVPRFSAFGLLFCFEDGGSTFLRNIIIRLPEYTVSHLRREQSLLCLCLQYDSQIERQLFS